MLMVTIYSLKHKKRLLNKTTLALSNTVCSTVTRDLD